MHGRCWCDGGPTTNPTATAEGAALPLYRGERCLRLLECHYWSEEEQARAAVGGELGCPLTKLGTVSCVITSCIVSP